MNNAEYLKYIQKASTRDALAEATARFLKDQNLGGKFIIIKYPPYWPPFKIIAGKKFLNFLEQGPEELRQLSTPVRSGKIISHHQKFFYFLSDADSVNVGYLWISTSRPDAATCAALDGWNVLNRLFQTNNERIYKQESVKAANLISQLLHDTEAIIQLIPEQNRSDELKNRLQYQQKLNADLLFYIRPLDLLKERLPLRSLIESSVQLIGLQSADFSLTISPDVSDIVADAELFARGFNEIIKNALFASGNNPAEVRVAINKIKRSLPLITCDWCRITVNNNGPAIPQDFLQQVKEPFFTTHKYEGFTGFGLSIAEKIFTAHNGSLEISSSQGRGSAITIYLPLADE